MGNAPSSPVRAQSERPEPVLDLVNGKNQEFPKETRTGEWFAVGDANLHVVPPSIIPPPSIPAPPPVSRARRAAVRLVGILAIGGTLAGLVRVATYAPAREAILRWGSFGKAAHLELPTNNTASRVR
jgi:hypothetical protein